VFARAGERLLKGDAVQYVQVKTHEGPLQKRLQAESRHLPIERRYVMVIIPRSVNATAKVTNLFYTF